MSAVGTDETEGLTVADVMHAEFASLPATATVSEVREWFAASASRRLAVLADGGRYLGALRPADVAGGVDGDRPAVELAGEHPTVAPDAPAAAGRDLVLGVEGRRLPVVDRGGSLVGVLAVTSDLRFFACRPAEGPGPHAGGQ